MIPFHKLMLEEIGVVRVCHQLQDLENDVGTRLTKACSAWIGCPSEIQGNKNQAGKVGNHWQGLGNLWYHPEGKATPIAAGLASYSKLARSSISSTEKYSCDIILHVLSSSDYGQTRSDEPKHRVEKAVVPVLLPVLHYKNIGSPLRRVDWQNFWA